MSDASLACWKALNEIIEERARQNAKWGEQNHEMSVWLAILGEEFGELCEAVLHKKFGGEAAEHVAKETVQVAAVALQMVEYLHRAKGEV